MWWYYWVFHIVISRFYVPESEILGKNIDSKVKFCYEK